MFKCSNGHTKEAVRAVGQTDCPICVCGETMVRDYKTELNTHSHFIPMHMSARNTSNKSDFLPDEKFFESPADPTGENGMKKWKSEHTTKNFREI